MSYDLIVIGGGPAGYVGAIRAAQLGKKVVCIEKERAGGTCLNWGCIPTKALLKNASLYQKLNKKSKEFGISFDNLSYDWSKIIGRSRKVSDRLAHGIEFLFKKNKVDYIVGDASIINDTKVAVVNEAGEEKTFEASNILLATGCKSRELPPLPFNGTSVISSKEAMNLPEQPASMTIIGAGAIGVEFAYIYNAFGTKVTIIERLPHILPVEDEEIAQDLEAAFKKQGIKVLTNAEITDMSATADSTTLKVTADNKEITLQSDVTLVAIGISPVCPTKGELPKLDDKGYIEVDERYQTSLNNIYAVGDIIGPPWLAHTASFEAIQCVEGLFIADKKPRQVTNFPGCTYAQPEVASIGKTEQMLKEEGIAYKVGRFPFAAIGKAQATGETDGKVKLLFGKEHGELLGAHIIGENATELIAEMGLAIEMECTAEEIHSTIHAHPTLAEAIHEATLDADGHAIHF